MSFKNPLSYHCPMWDCGRSFTRRSILQDHLNGPDHANLKPYQCSQCSVCFTRKGDRTKHEQNVHEGRRPYRCGAQGCGLAYASKTQLNRHLKARPEHARSFEPADLDQIETLASLELSGRMEIDHERLSELECRIEPHEPNIPDNPVTESSMQTLSSVDTPDPVAARLTEDSGRFRDVNFVISSKDEPTPRCVSIPPDVQPDLELSSALNLEPTGHSPDPFHGIESIPVKRVQQNAIDDVHHLTQALMHSSHASQYLVEEVEIDPDLDKFYARLARKLRRLREMDLVLIERQVRKMLKETLEESIRRRDKRERELYNDLLQEWEEFAGLGVENVDDLQALEEKLPNEKKWYAMMHLFETEEREAFLRSLARERYRQALPSSAKNLKADWLEDWLDDSFSAAFSAHSFCKSVTSGHTDSTLESVRAES